MRYVDINDFDPENQHFASVRAPMKGAVVYSLSSDLEGQTLGGLSRKHLTTDFSATRERSYYLTPYPLRRQLLFPLLHIHIVWMVFRPRAFNLERGAPFFSSKPTAVDSWNFPETETREFFFFYNRGNGSTEYCSDRQDARKQNA